LCAGNGPFRKRSGRALARFAAKPRQRSRLGSSDLRVILERRAVWAGLARARPLGTRAGPPGRVHRPYGTVQRDHAPTSRQTHAGRARFIRCQGWSTRRASSDQAQRGAPQRTHEATGQGAGRFPVSVRVRLGRRGAGRRCLDDWAGQSRGVGKRSRIGRAHPILVPDRVRARARNLAPDSAVGPGT
jgi:hypothetical protein